MEMRSILIMYLRKDSIGPCMDWIGLDWIGFPILKIEISKNKMLMI